jgi:hypothetical protein
VTWLDKYSQTQYFGILRLASAYERERISLEALVKGLDEVLDIWTLEPEEWSDPLLLTCADLLNKYRNARYQLPSALTDADHRVVSDVLTPLKVRALQGVLDRLSDATDAYEQGKMDLWSFAQALWRGLHNLDDGDTPISGLSQDWLASFRGIVYDMDSITDIAYEQGFGAYDGQVPHWIARDIAELRELVRAGCEELPDAAE